jgi:DnaJ like chaperone protein
MQELPGYVVALFFFTPLLGGIVWYAYKTRHARSWRKGIVPPKMKFSEDNLLEVYLSIGARLILLDYQRHRGKANYINQYFNRYFRSANYDFGDSLLFSMKHPVQIDSACAWLNSHLSKEGERAQVVYFLTGMAWQEEQVNARELAFLALINQKLGLEEGNLKRILGTFTAYKDSKKERTREQAAPRQKVAKVNYFQVLGVSQGASQEDIKKAYRKLVKLHHPDVFANASEAQQRLARENFIRIQEAYEGLTA